jgi:hypothetical protein
MLVFVVKHKLKSWFHSLLNVCDNVNERSVAVVEPFLAVVLRLKLCDFLDGEGTCAVLNSILDLKLRG